MQALFAYIACMDDRQYTIRAVPASVDRALRRRAKAEGKSLNAVAIEALERGLELDAKPRIFTDLDHFAGTWVEDPEFDRVMEDFQRIDEDMWK